MQTRRATENDDGFTMVELVVALGLLALLMVSLASMFYASMSAAATANRRTEATGLATRETESIRAVAYPAIGFYTDQFSGTPPAGTVILGPTAPANVFLTPSGTGKPGPVEFRIERSITWADARPGSTDLPEAYKKTTVTVSWTEASGTVRSVVQESIVYPGGCGEYGAANACGTASSPTVGIAPNPPTNAQAVTPAAPAGETTISVSWSAPVGGEPVHEYYVEYSTDLSFSRVTPRQSSTTTTLDVSPLSAGTSYNFRVVAVAADGYASQPSNTTSATTHATSASGCGINGLSVVGARSKSTTKTYLTNKNEMSEDIDLGLSTNNLCTGSFKVRAASDVTVAPGSPWAMTPKGGGDYTGKVASDGAPGWSAGLYVFSVQQNGGDVSPQVTHQFLVCQYVAPKDRSASPTTC